LEVSCEGILYFGAQGVPKLNLDNREAQSFERLLGVLCEDIEESTNLTSTHPEKTEELTKLLDQWQEDVGADFPLPNPDFDPDKRYQWSRHP